jgi:hypothetical protein
MYLAMLQVGFRAACRARGCVERRLVIGDRAVRLRFAGPALVEPMSGALAHLQAQTPAPVAATVLLWDAASTGVALPPVQWRADDMEDHGQSRGFRVRGWDGERVYTLHDQDYGAITIFDLSSRVAVFATRDASAVPLYERAAPLRVVLHWALSEPGRHLLHAGAVGGPAGGVLVAGKSGSGKSTLALSCAEAGLGYAGDDYVLVDLRGERPAAHAVHSTVKLDPEGTGARADLDLAALARDPTDSGKVVVDVARHRPEALVRTVALRAVVLPRVAGGTETVTGRVSAAEGVRALAPSTVLQHFGHGATGMATVAELMRRIPAYRMDLGRDMSSAVAAVARLARGPDR